MSNFRMKIGTKQKHTEGNISEKDSNLIKASHLYKMAGAPLTAPGDMYATEKASAEMAEDAPSDYEQMGAAFEAGQADGDELASAMSGDGSVSREDLRQEHQEGKKKMAEELFK